MKIKLANLIVILAVLIATVIIIIPLPDSVPVHFDIHGVADRWGSKYELLLMPGVMLAMLGFWVGSEKKLLNLTDADDEKKAAEAENNKKVFNLTFSACTLLFTVLNFLFLNNTISQLEGDTGASVDVMRTVAITMGITFIFLGNFMPKAKNNPNVGFRLPWTRYNDVTWYKCNRMSGIAMVIYGLITTAIGIIFSGITSFIIMLALLLVNIIFLTVYAYLVYRKERKNEK